MLGLWVRLKKVQHVTWSGGQYTLYPGEMGRVMKANDDGTWNVAFGMAKGVHPISRQDIEVRD